MVISREVFGRRVIADEPTPSPISDRAGRQVLWQQTRTLTLDDGSTAYGCAHCDYASRNINSIRPHLGKHNRRNGHKPADELSLSQILRQLAALEKVTADRDEWKARALKAEHSLTMLRQALGVVR